jgi:RNA polymerase sigma-70 factor, ECF subfamily
MQGGVPAMPIEPFDLKELYQTYRPLLFSLAYRMLGSVMDAEDMVQDTFAALGKVSREGVGNIKAYLCKMLTNRCLDQLRSARQKREVYIGPWLPEPLVWNDENDPLAAVLSRDNLSLACLTLMERLTPIERAVFLLREVFDFEYAEIAGVVGKAESNCRKIFSRVKQKLAAELPEHTPDYARDQELLAGFVEGIATGNAEKVLRLLAADAVLYSDGGGKVQGALHPIRSRDHVLRFLQGIVRISAAAPPVLQFATVNGSPGLVAVQDGWVETVLAIDWRDGQAAGIYIVRNPEKLGHLQGLA